PLAEGGDVAPEGAPALGREALLAALGLAQELGRGDEEMGVEVARIAPLDLGAPSRLRVGDRGAAVEVRVAELGAVLRADEVVVGLGGVAEARVVEAPEVPPARRGEGAERAEEAVGDAARRAPARALHGDDPEEQGSGDRDRRLDRPGLRRTELPHAAILTDPRTPTALRPTRRSSTRAASACKGFRRERRLPRSAKLPHRGPSPPPRRTNSRGLSPSVRPAAGVREPTRRPTWRRFLSISFGMRIAKALGGEGIPGAARGLPARGRGRGNSL